MTKKSTIYVIGRENFNCREFQAASDSMLDDPFGLILAEIGADIV